MGFGGHYGDGLLDGDGGGLSPGPDKAPRGPDRGAGGGYLQPEKGVQILSTLPACNRRRDNRQSFRTCSCTNEQQ